MTVICHNVVHRQLDSDCAGIVACMGLGRASSALSRLHVNVRVPTELWGATNALAAGLCSAPLRDDRGQAARLPEAVRMPALHVHNCCWDASRAYGVLPHAPKICVAVGLQTSNAAESSTLGMPPQAPESMRERLDFRPALQQSEVHARLPHICHA